MNEVIEKYFKDTYQILIFKMTRATGTVWDAEDVVQTALERAIKYQATWSKDVEFATWMSPILRNALIDKLNEDRGIVYEELDEFNFEAAPTIDYDQVLNMVKEMIEEEREEIRPILELHFLKGYKAKDIYEFNKLSYPNTRKIIQRFRDRVKMKLDES